MKRIKRRIIGTLACAVIGACMCSTVAFAHSDEEEVVLILEEMPVESIVDVTEQISEVVAEETKLEEDFAEVSYGPLTPEGNLTLVDDYGEVTGAGKQFITVVTKTGNYFYIIIDRDDNGAETVHFLNLVDEVDILNLMEEEDVEAYKKSVSAGDATPVETLEETPELITDVSSEGEELVEEPETVDRGSLVMVIVVMVVMAVGAGAFVLMKVLEKKKEEKTKVDPDADYVDEEEDYLAQMPVEDMPEDDDYEESE